MTSIAIVGAGHGLGKAVARRFGREGFSVGLLSRRQESVDALAEELRAEGIDARGFQADVRDPASLAGALEQVAETLGQVEVLQYSPLPQKDFMRPVLETTVADLVGPIEFSVYGPVAAVHQVLQGMRFIPGGGKPSILFVNGGSSITPGVKLTGTSIAFAGETAYAQLLHEALADEGIHVAQLVIRGGINADDPEKSPETMAEHLWDLHSKRDRFRHIVEKE
ncbi:Diacetyl reductase [(S)-acetoin forming] [Frondihabitans sp. 762G35]|uniref:SDR family NAD(P)-dependent oxidoreductase n=1 Tax=Frondihabitans sp. 762G35 TaxID=1446794 RepID=UPI000D229A68|nr:SDR family NAD(P)-dependent oxidoreductase [Frondihabitans sp. 762G35]ARC57976.1 Diacetyl reductase [(S)-acetoin forming] [Frondihabitans sp. 762G35]